MQLDDRRVIQIPWNDFAYFAFCIKVALKIVSVE